MTETSQPVVNALNRPFWEAASAGKLALQRCETTQRFFWPPSPRSPFTGGPVAWMDCDAGGTVESIVIYRRPFQQAFAALLPYGIASIALDAGPRLLVHVTDPDGEMAPKAGDRAVIGFRQLLDDGPLLPIALGGLASSQ